MPFQKHKRTSNMKESIKAFSAIIMLLFYAIGNIPVEIIHQFVHAHVTVVVHSIAQEKDPCHVSLYHEGRDGSCEHKTHVVTLDSCNLCHLIFHSDPLIVTNSFQQTNQSYFFSNEHVASGLPGDFVVQLPSRAPPVLFIA